MELKDKALVGGLIYKIILDLIVVVGLLMTELDGVRIFVLLNFIIKIAIDIFAIIRIYKYNKESE